ncbi:unnamed protein product [Rhizophagus irregularis]|nr:unnamed protein product [Rhizophagus irregularis]
MKKYYLDFENTNHLSLFTRGSAFRKKVFPSGRDFGRKDSGFLAPLNARAWTREISTTGSLDLQAHGILIWNVRIRWSVALLRHPDLFNDWFLGFWKSDCVVNFSS